MLPRRACLVRPQLCERELLLRAVPCDERRRKGELGGRELARAATFVRACPSRSLLRELPILHEEPLLRELELSLQRLGGAFRVGEPRRFGVALAGRSPYIVCNRCRRRALRAPWSVCTGHGGRYGRGRDFRGTRSQSQDGQRARSDRGRVGEPAARAHRTCRDRPRAWRGK
jgi:hypothetical protein